jgi:hypothetical protein
MNAYSMEEDREKFLDAGLDDYLAKPIKADILINKVKSWLEFEPKEVNIEPVKHQAEPLVINQNTLNQLSKFGGQELIESTLIDFREESKELLQSIIDHYQAGNYEGMKKDLHTLKGNAGTLGVEKVSKQSSRIEKKLKQDNFDHIESDLNILVSYHEEFIESSQNLLVTNE